MSKPFTKELTNIQLKMLWKKYKIHQADEKMVRGENVVKQAIFGIHVYLCYKSRAHLRVHYVHACNTVRIHLGCSPFYRPVSLLINKHMGGRNFR